MFTTFIRVKHPPIRHLGVFNSKNRSQPNAFFSFRPFSSRCCAMHAGDSHDYFTYTSGRWIYNESLRLSERYVAFDVSELKRVAASSVGRSESDISSFRKLAEGGFNRTFEIVMRDGVQLVARIPFQITKPKHFAVASEVATLDFVRLQGIPVPRVFAYSVNDDNPVGTEYIIMEKVLGNELGNLWYSMTEAQRLKAVFQIVKLETLLFSIELPASGSIYYKHDLPRGVSYKEIEVAGGARTFCIGPNAHYKWWHIGRSSLSIERGPFSDSQEVLKSVAKRELRWIEEFGRARFLFEPLYRELYSYEKVEPAEHIRNLRDFLQVAQFLSPPVRSSFNRPIVRHPDLQPNNIFVSDSFDIVSLIDWQHCSVRPLFLHAGPPKYFQNYGDEDSENFVKPQLPANFDHLDENEKIAAKEIFRKRQLHYYYFAATAKFNQDHFDACTDDGVILKQKLFQHAGDPWEGDSVTLKADLIRTCQCWQELVGGDVNARCPLDYSTAEVDECFRLEAEQRLADEDMEKSRNCLGISVDGWVTQERYDAAKELSERFKAEAIALAESEEIGEKIRQHWPFDDHKEDE